MSATVPALLARVDEYLVQEGFTSTRIDDSALTFWVRGDSGAWRCAVVIHGEGIAVEVRSMFEGPVPEARMHAMAELISRVNFGLLLGAFEMDFDDGEFAFRTSAPVVGGELPDDALQGLIGSNLSTVNDYYPAIMRLIYGQATPLEVLEAVHGESEEGDES